MGAADRRRGGVAALAPVCTAALAVAAAAVSVKLSGRPGLVETKFVALHLVLMAGIIAWVAAGARTGPWRGMGGGVPLGCFVVLGMAAVVRVSGDGVAAGEDGFMGLTRLFFNALLFLAAFLAGRDAVSARRSFAVIALAAAVVSLEGILQACGRGILPWRQYDVSVDGIWSTIGSRNVVAQFLVGSIPLCAGLALAARGRVSRVVVWASAAVGVMCMALTGCWGGYAGLVASVLAAVWWLLRQVRRAAVSKAAVCVLAVVVVVPVVAGSGLVTSRWSGSAEDRMTEPGESETFRGRMLLWRTALAMIRERPSFGHGPGAFRREARAYWPRVQGGVLGGRIPDRVHNDYLQMAVETGILALGCFIWLSAGVLRRGMRELARGAREGDEDSRAWRALLAGALAAIAGMLVHSLVSFGLHSPAPGALFWMALGLASGLSKGACAAPSSASAVDLGAAQQGGRRIPRAVIAGTALLLVLMVRWSVFPVLGYSWLRAGLVHGENERWHEAYSACVAAGRYLPASSEVSRARGVSARFLGRPAEARVWFEDALVLDPWDLDARWNLAQVLAEMGEEDRARRQWERVQEIDPAFAERAMAPGSSP